MRRVSFLVAGKVASFDSTIEGFFSLLLARLSYKQTGFIFLVISFIFFELLFPSFNFAFANISSSLHLNSPLNLKTESLFTEKITEKTQVLKFQKQVVIDYSLPPGETKIITAGKDGQKIIQTKVIYHQSSEYTRESKVISDIKPTKEVVAIGVSPEEGIVDTPYGQLRFKNKLNVWATAYDSTCNGCDDFTALGLRAGYGVIAVDPSIIPLRSRVYVPGYGVAIAGDTGGSVKGNKIDLGFADVRTSGWTSRYTEVYLLTD